MKIWLRYTFGAILLTAVFASMVVILSTTREQRKLATCTDIRLTVEDDFSFFTEDEIKGIVENGYGTCVGQKLDSVGLAKIEKVLDNQSAILKSQAWTTSDGVLHLSIRQRIPTLRVCNGQDGFYMDSEGSVFPLQASYTYPAYKVQSEIPLSTVLEHGDWTDGILKVVKFVTRSRQWKEGISEIRLGQNGELAISMGGGCEKFLFGFPEDIPEKFARIRKYYEYIKPARDSAYYKTVNVKYDGQIICRK